MDEPTPINLGTGMEITIRELVELIARLTGFDGEIRWDASKPDGQPRRCLDTTRAKEKLGWEARVGFEEGLRRTIGWWEGQGRADCERSEAERAERDRMAARRLGNGAVAGGGAA